MSLNVTDLTCYRGGRLIFGDLSFSLIDGEAMMLRGPNGVGKSTLLRALAGMLDADGTIALNGEILAQNKDAVQDQIAYAGHLDAIKPQLTVAENLTFWANLFSDGDVEDAVEQFSLAEIWDRPAHACSAGQKRRLGLARLMVSQRRLWLLDEPTVSLDIETAARFAQIVTSHCNSGGMALIATHIDLGLAEARELRLEPVTQAHLARSDDPFLSDEWA